MVVKTEIVMWRKSQLRIVYDTADGSVTLWAAERPVCQIDEDGAVLVRTALPPVLVQTVKQCRRIVDETPEVFYVS